MKGTLLSSSLPFPQIQRHILQKVFSIFDHLLYRFLNTLLSAKEGLLCFFGVSMGHKVNAMFFACEGVLHHYFTGCPVQSHSPQLSTEIITFQVHPVLLFQNIDSLFHGSRLFNLNKTFIFFCNKEPTLLTIVSERPQVVT